MNKLIASFTALVFTSAGAIDYKPSEVACDNAIVNLGRFPVNAIYKEPAIFPNPTMETKVGEGDSLNCPNLAVHITKEKVLIKTGGRAEMQVTVFEKHSITLAAYAMYRYPNISQETDSYEILINYDGVIHSGPEKLTIKDNQIQDLPFKNLLVGYKLNGQDLSPLIFEGKIYPIPRLNFDDTLEIYIQSHQVANYQKIVIDRKTNTIELIKKADFPTK